MIQNQGACPIFSSIVLELLRDRWKRNKKAPYLEKAYQALELYFVSNFLKLLEI